MSKEIERTKECKDFYKYCLDEIIPSSKEDIETMEMWEYTNQQLEMRIPESLIDDNLCPNCKVSIRLLTYNYCPYCGKAIATNQNIFKKYYHYIPTERLLKRLNVNETYNRKGKKVIVKLVGSYHSRTHLFDNYYIFYDEDEIYHIEDANKKQIIMTFGCDSGSKARNIAIKSLSKEVSNE